MIPPPILVCRFPLHFEADSDDPALPDVAEVPTSHAMVTDLLLTPLAMPPEIASSPEMLPLPLIATETTPFDFSEDADLGLLEEMEQPSSAWPEYEATAEGMVWN